MLEAIHRGAEGADARPTVILCHGFGASADDLSPLAAELLPHDDVCWYFPQAPYRFQTLWGEGRAWFPRDPAGVEAFLAGEIHTSLATKDPGGLRDAGAELVEFMESVGCDPAMTVVGGFSQGTMVAVEALMQMTRRPAGMLLFSGGIIAAERWREVSRSRTEVVSGLDVAAYHGQEDPVLAFAAGRAMAGLLEDAGAHVEFTPFHGGHGIPAALFESVTQHLRRMLSLR
jgi:phospholipase/carboxylesterase